MATLPKPSASRTHMSAAEAAVLALLNVRHHPAAAAA